MREHYGKTLLARHLSEHGVNVDARGFLVRTDVKEASSEHTWTSLIRREPLGQDHKTSREARPIDQAEGQGRVGVCQQDDK